MPVADNDPPAIHLDLDLDLDLDLVYQKILATCQRLGIEPPSRERALGLMHEWTEQLSGRPSPPAKH